VNAASFGPRLGIGAYATIFGEHITGAQLRINGALVLASFTSDRQVNFLSPATLSSGPADVSVETALGVSIARVEFNTYAPGIFVPAAGYIQAGAAQQPGSVSFYATGAGGSFGESLQIRVDGAAVSSALSAAGSDLSATSWNPASLCCGARASGRDAHSRPHRQRNK